MKHYMIILMLIPLCLCAGGDPMKPPVGKYAQQKDSEASETARRAQQRYVQQPQPDSGLTMKIKMKSIKELEHVKEPAPGNPPATETIEQAPAVKEPKLIALFLKHCCCVSGAKD